MSSSMFQFLIELVRWSTPLLSFFNSQNESKNSNFELQFGEVWPYFLHLLHTTFLSCLDLLVSWTAKFFLVLSYPDHELLSFWSLLPACLVKAFSDVCSFSVFIASWRIFLILLQIIEGVRNRFCVSADQGMLWLGVGKFFSMNCIIFHTYACFIREDMMWQGIVVLFSFLLPLGLLHSWAWRFW